MYKCLNEFVELLDKNGELIRIKEFVNPVLEIAEITDRVSKMPGGGKALLFENTGTSFPVLTNMMGSEKRMALALGVDSLDQFGTIINDLFAEIMTDRQSVMDKLKILPVLREASQWFPKKHKGHAPCQEVVFYKPDIGRLPVLQCWPDDGGRFVTLPLVHTVSPADGSRNVGMYRMQIFSEDTTGMHWHRHKTGAKHFRECKNGKLPVAVCLGGDPSYTYAATAPLPDGIDEYLLAGFLRNKPVTLTECLTQDLLVPADCDIVIEGYVDKAEAPVTEGPFGDHTGFYSLPDLYPVFHVTCITHRKDAIYPATLVGIPPQEDKYIALATEKIFSSPIKIAMVPEMTDFYIPEEGTGHNFAIVKIEKTYPGQAVKVAHSLWGAGQMMFNKILIVTDSEIDIRDWCKIFDVMKEHYLPRRDTHFSRGPLDVLDHAAPQCGYGGKMLLDITSKMPEERGNGPERAGSGKAVNFTTDPDDSSGLINILLDKNASDADLYTSLWLWGSNCDPVRDCTFREGRLFIDAKRKSPDGKGLIRDWPEIAVSSADTIKAIDEKWESLGIGEFIPSPSHKFASLSKGQGQ
jgi:4-hydroxy-3-polyprenylbenzoate decarboxylase